MSRLSYIFFMQVYYNGFHYLGNEYYIRFVLTLVSSCFLVKCLFLLNQ